MRVFACSTVLILSACSSAPPWPESAQRMCTKQVECLGGEETVATCVDALEFVGDAGCESLYDVWLACLADDFETGCGEVESYQDNSNTACTAEDLAYFQCPNE